MSGGSGGASGTALSALSTSDPRAAAALLDHLADRGWPAEHRESHGGWILRAAGGVTKRANSALPAGPVDDPAAALDRAEAFAREHGIAACVQVSPASEPADLAALLTARGYAPEARTLVQVQDAAAAAEALRPGSGRDALDADLVVTVDDAPDDAWLDVWWSVDGRGGSAEREVARRILVRGPALYAAVRAGDRVLATARLALVDGWGGLFAVATRPEARRRGLSRAAMGAAVRVGLDRGITGLWLQVVEENAGAQALYARLGFTTASRYAYWTRPGA
ncbi:ribosomal-protein-alanine N-acetyltransferase [Clavibacter michiganensis]|uniref:Ribosomal-protein-alanine N-acetyltransferase n=1 Tax=Clavibacter michiganensis TaxID=28447 RepID=A0A251YI20_9MICO|nr:GNAT family N-acetyltransferase [Clavibacter michiganensis]OUE23891.1 ribosomal-protein-alanine N-acetyltransferase [Clavibacter michiganensis]